MSKNYKLIIFKSNLYKTIFYILIEKNKTYAIGDLHGNFKALKRVLKKWHFRNEADRLIFLGDLADGHSHPDKCLLRLLEIKDLIPIIGNHDLFLKKWLDRGIIDERWKKIGAKHTIDALYDYKPELKEYFSKAVYYHVQDGMIFTHGGFNHKRLITKQRKLNFAINRNMYRTSKQYARQNIKFKPIFDEKNSVEIDCIFIGHSPTENYLPAFNSNLINLDTGAGNGGKLTMIDIYSKKYVQS